MGWLCNMGVTSHSIIGSSSGEVPNGLRSSSVTVSVGLEAINSSNYIQIIYNS